jgi:MFS family permease
MPGGAIVDAARSERGVAALAMIAISASALVIALLPIFPSVLGAQFLHAAGSSVVNPAIAAISLGLVGHAASGERFGRNARFASIGNGLAAAGMGAVGYFWSNQAVFLVTAALIIPTLIALAQIRSDEIDPVRAHGEVPQGQGAYSLISGSTSQEMLSVSPGALRVTMSLIISSCAGLANELMRQTAIASTFSVRSASTARSASAGSTMPRPGRQRTWNHIARRRSCRSP